MRLTLRVRGLGHVPLSTVTDSPAGSTAWHPDPMPRVLGPRARGRRHPLRGRQDHGCDGFVGRLRPSRATPRRGAKVGPDFIDPGYHALACGLPPRNLDAWLCGTEAIPPWRHGPVPGRVCSSWKGSWGSSTARWTAVRRRLRMSPEMIGAPVVLVVDASAMSSSVAALVHGFATFDPRVSLGGVILNRVGSPGHEILLREALAVWPRFLSSVLFPTRTASTGGTGTSAWCL